MDLTSEMINFFFLIKRKTPDIYKICFNPLICVLYACVGCLHTYNLNDNRTAEELR